MNRLDDLVDRARAGDLDAFAHLVERTQAMTYAVAKSVVRDASLAEDAATRLDPWQVTAQALHAVDVLLPGRAVKLVPTKYPMCSQAWQLEVDDDGQWAEVMAWGVFTDTIVRQLGADPRVHTAIGVGYGLERFAMVRFGNDDIRKIDEARVA